MSCYLPRVITLVDSDNYYTLLLLFDLQSGQKSLRLFQTFISVSSMHSFHSGIQNTPNTFSHVNNCHWPIIFSLLGRGQPFTYVMRINLRLNLSDYLLSLIDARKN